jgi:hypothetical protein
MPTPYGQLLHWVDTEDEQMLAHLSPDSATAVATTLMWAFPSPDRFLRDQATRRLVKLVSIHPELLPLLLQDAIVHVRGQRSAPPTTHAAAAVSGWPANHACPSLTVTGVVWGADSEGQAIGNQPWLVMGS